MQQLREELAALVDKKMNPQKGEASSSSTQPKSKPKTKTTRKRKIMGWEEAARGKIITFRPSDSDSAKKNEKQPQTSIALSEMQTNTVVDESEWEGVADYNPPPLSRSTIPASVWTQCASLQLEEIDTLRNIYGAQLIVSDSLPVRVCVPLRDPELESTGGRFFTFPRPLRLTLVVAFHPAYPLCVRFINAHNLPNVIHICYRGPC